MFKLVNFYIIIQSMFLHLKKSYKLTFCLLRINISILYVEFEYFFKYNTWKINFYIYQIYNDIGVVHYAQSKIL